ncbi:methyltransferase family protein [Nocardioides bizhenqiangii]|uniref:Isoprenylcysteine carboxylmethyltransferase family protein n=1 Tax=Nocardioides bizhenqiangii TaxID=3095076 RepID=A0ABZ0ZTT9_9ACTN|nr:MULTISPECIES: isoprenylcysteine carboxylmethyltransferase family protein [unclassified Nocardioides]MDZ5621820.1 isoprenylcysteine carboxylmethyltransferase family protein [Nocardioides sp. HM23]WQQ27495.1 isoprenylcysteine carboxylmethyltransferase family protein [Nocardioides sp. HM61]
MPAVPPPAYAVAGLVAQHLLADNGRAGPVRKVAAGAVAAASAALAVGSIRRFRAGGTTVEPFHPERASALVTSGPNALTRNPMYVGMAGLLAAHALVRGGWLPAVPVAAFVAVIDQTQIRPEEAALRALFGQEYDEYCARVPRWLTGLPL